MNSILLGSSEKLKFLKKSNVQMSFSKNKYIQKQMEKKRTLDLL